MQDIAAEIDRESKIITDLLTLVKLNKKASNMNIEQVNINELLDLILKRLRPIAAKRNIELILEGFRPVDAEIDETKLSLAISNLVENAIKYNKDEGWVRVSLNADHKYFYVTVTDSGGIHRPYLRAILSGRQIALHRDRGNRSGAGDYQKCHHDASRSDPGEEPGG